MPEPPMNEATRILIVEDSAADAELAEHEICRSLTPCQFQQVDNRREYLDALENFRPDLIITDYTMPQFDGMIALQLALQHTPTTPVIVWTGSINEDIAVKCMKAGASNYVLKDNLKRLGAAVLHALEEKKILIEQRQAEARLQDSEAKYRALVENLPDIIMRFDRECRHLFVSPSVKRVVTIPPEEFIGKTHRELGFPAEQAEFWEKTIRFAFSAAQPVRREFEFPASAEKAAGFTTIVFEWDLIPEKDHQGQINSLLSIARDITARKRAEQALEKHIVALTRPLEDEAYGAAHGVFVGLAFEELFNLEDIQRLQDEFAQAVNVASVITRLDGVPLTRPSNFTRFCNDIVRKTEKGRFNCFRAEAALGQLASPGPVILPCLSGGLWDAGAVISIGDRRIAHWLIGQVRDNTQTEETIRQYAHEIGVDEHNLVEAYREVPVMSPEQFRRIGQMLFTLANQLSTAAYQNVQQARFITDLQRAEEKIKKNLAEKDILLRELYHRTRNNMGVISALLELQVAEVGDERLRLAYTDTQNRIRAMALVHQKLYDAGDLSHINLKEYIIDLSTLLMNSYHITRGEISLNLELDDIMLIIDMAIPCGLILDELISNALKYAFPGDQNGSITIILRKAANGEIYLRVADDGIGTPPDFDFRRDGHLGLQNVFALGENQLGGEVGFTSKPGVACQISFRSDSYKPRV